MRYIIYRRAVMDDSSCIHFFFGGEGMCFVRSKVLYEDSKTQLQSLGEAFIVEVPRTEIEVFKMHMDLGDYRDDACLPEEDEELFEQALESLLNKSSNR